MFTIKLRLGLSDSLSECQPLGLTHALQVVSMRNRITVGKERCP